MQQVVCVRRIEKLERKKTRKNPAPLKTHHEIHSSPATAASRRLVAKYVPCVSPCSPASIDPGFVEVCLVQLSQSVKTTNVAHTLTDTQTDRRTTDRLIKYWYPVHTPVWKGFLPKGKRRPHYIDGGGNCMREYRPYCRDQPARATSQPTSQTLWLVTAVRPVLRTASAQK